MGKKLDVIKIERCVKKIRCLKKIVRFVRKDKRSVRKSDIFAKK